MILPPNGQEPGAKFIKMKKNLKMRPAKAVALVRPNKTVAFEFQPETVVVIGNGAIDGDGWAPARRALQKNDFAGLSPQQRELYLELNPQIQLAHVGFFSRITLLTMLRESRALDDNAYAHYVHHLEPSLKQLEQFRHRLGDEYKNSQGKDLMLRELPTEIQNVLSNTSVGSITTNWDEILWEDKRFTHHIQLHGRASAPGTLILPTESMVDHEAIRNIHLGGELSKKEEIVVGAYERSGRGESEMSELFFAYDYARGWIRGAKNIIIYGIAGHIYDVELHSLFLGHGDVERVSVTIISDKQFCIDQWARILRVKEPILRPVLVK